MGVALVALSGLIVAGLVVGRRPREAGVRQAGPFVLGYVALAAIFGTDLGLRRGR